MTNDLYAEWKKLKNNAENTSARLYYTKNENTEREFEEAVEALVNFEKENGIPLIADEAKVKEIFCPQTNEEWFISLPSAEKAKVFGAMLFEALKDGLAEEIHDKRFYEDLIEFWLAEEHKS